MRARTCVKLVRAAATGLCRGAEPPLPPPMCRGVGVGAACLPACLPAAPLLEGGAAVLASVEPVVAPVEPALSLAPALALAHCACVRARFRG